MHTFNCHHPTVAILQMRIAGLSHCATQGLDRLTVHTFNSHNPTGGHFTNEKSWPIPTMHSFNSLHPTVAILQMRIADLYPTVHT